MWEIEELHLIQWSFFEAQTFQLAGNAAILGPNAVGKSSVMDAIQVGLLGPNMNHLSFNSQSVSNKQRRTIKDYCLGACNEGDDGYKRSQAHTYITLVFRNLDTNSFLSAGACIVASRADASHRIRGLYVLPGVRLTLEDHLDRFNDGVAPKPWQAFQKNGLDAGRAAGRTVSIDDKPEKYLSELLHAIRPPNRNIDRVKFARAFSKSMTLKDIENINDFVRDYLIGHTEVKDRKNLLNCISRMQEIQKLVETTEKEIEDLGRIEKQMDHLLDTFRKRDTAQAVKAIIEREVAEERVDDIQTKLGQALKEIAIIEPQFQLADTGLNDLEATIRKLELQIERDPEVAQARQAQALWKNMGENVELQIRRLNSSLLKARRALQVIKDYPHEMDQEIKSYAARKLDVLSSLDSDRAMPELHEMQEIENRIKAAMPYLETLSDACRSREAAIKGQIEALINQSKAYGDGIRVKDGRVAIAMKIFAEAGIDSRPVSALVTIKDRSWQAAIESFLHRNREALVVAPGRERDAVRILRKSRDWAYAVIVVQPHHLREFAEPGIKEVGSLIMSENDTARKFILANLGKMRCVETEEELEQFPNAITKDGMLSRNGGTRKLPLLDEAEWLIGAKLSQDEASSLHSALMSAQDRKSTNDALRKQLSAAMETLQNPVDLNDYQDTLTSLRNTQMEMSQMVDPTSLGEPAHLEGLKLQLSSLQLEHQQKKRDRDALLSSHGRLQSDISHLEGSLPMAKSAFGHCQRACDQAMEAKFFTPTLQVSLYERMLAQTKPIAACEEYEAAQVADIMSRKQRAMIDFFSYANNAKLTLAEEREDWEKAHTYVKNRGIYLTETTLAEKRAEAAEALKNAYTAFHTDTVLSVREAMQTLEDTIHGLNKTLEACPAFTRGEKYKFEARPAKQYEHIYHYLRQSRFNLDSSSESLFEEGDEVGLEIMNMIKESADLDSSKSHNPIDDFRLLYNFDLGIYQDGKRIGSLSSRMGRGSNGEHKVPFYIIAAAALASASRIDNRDTRGRGSSFMLLDEAFNSLDSENLYATAKFLNAMGLQLILVGPDADAGKLVPFTNVIHIMSRYGMDVDVETMLIKEPMRKLMVSDMPSENPDLVDAMEAKFIAAEVPAT